MSFQPPAWAAGRNVASNGLLLVLGGREQRHVPDSWILGEVVVDLISCLLTQWGDEEEAFLVPLVTPPNRDEAGDVRRRQVR